MGGVLISHTDQAHPTWCISPSIGSCNGVRRHSGAGTGVNRVDTRAGLGNRLSEPQRRSRRTEQRPVLLRSKGGTLQCGVVQKNAGKQREDFFTHMGVDRASILLSCRVRVKSVEMANALPAWQSVAHRCGIRQLRWAQRRRAHGVYHNQ